MLTLQLHQSRQEQALGGERTSRHSLFILRRLPHLREQRREADEGQPRSTSWLGVEPAANRLPSLQFGVGRQIGGGALGEPERWRVHRARLQGAEALVPAPPQLPRPVAPRDETALDERLERRIVRRKVGRPAVPVGDTGRAVQPQLAAELAPVEDMGLGRSRLPIIEGGYAQCRRRGCCRCGFRHIQQHFLGG